MLGVFGSHWLRSTPPPQPPHRPLTPGSVRLGSWDTSVFKCSGKARLPLSPHQCGEVYEVTHWVVHSRARGISCKGVYFYCPASNTPRFIAFLNTFYAIIVCFETRLRWKSAESRFHFVCFSLQETLGGPAREFESSFLGTKKKKHRWSKCQHKESNWNLLSKYKQFIHNELGCLFSSARGFDDLRVVEQKAIISCSWAVFSATPFVFVFLFCFGALVTFAFQQIQQWNKVIIFFTPEIKNYVRNMFPKLTSSHTVCVSIPGFIAATVFFFFYYTNWFRFISAFIPSFWSGARLFFLLFCCKLRFCVFVINNPTLMTPSIISPWLVGWAAGRRGAVVLSRADLEKGDLL